MDEDERWDSPSQGWAALRSGNWTQARASFEAALTERPSPEGADGLARALWWLGDVDGAIDSWERAYAGYRKLGEHSRASRVALFLSREYAEARGNRAAANGWLARARELLRDEPPSAGHGWLKLVEAQAASDPSDSLERATEALEAGRQFDDADLELSALGVVGLAEISVARIEEGMTRFDEAMAAATAGEPGDLRTLGDLYCSMTLACELTLDASRFEQWNEVVMGFMMRTNHPALFTFCGTCCAAVLGAAGQWDEGEKWLTDTLRTLESSGQRARCVHPATKLASLRVMQGRLEEAERLLDGYEDLPEAVQPLVALYLARGQTALAAARLHRRLNQVGRDNLVAVPLLALLVDVQLAQGDHSGAATTAQMLEEIGRQSGRERVQAEADLAAGCVMTAVGDSGAAAHLERAIDLFASLHMPHGAARAHLALAESLASDGDPVRAIEEARQARQAFERLGATRDADAASGFLRGLGVGGRTGPKLLGELSKRELEVLRLLGEGLTNAEIAARLYISTKTVATHVGNIFGKLQLRNRAEAAAYAHRYLSEDIPAT
ncbi:MAG TPA: response regulator transcription factor [Actinomycetota bacterium]|nr:response regulator transcription factor [Actinomycetota bacterium]